jgi:hypothetical protein
MMLCAVAMTLVAGCKRNDSVTQAEKADKINGVAAPGIEETKQIAQEGFIYGLPLVMYYTSAYELFVDPTSGQFKAPVGKLNNEARVFTYKDTAVITPNSDTPYSLMEVDLRAEPTVISLPAVPKPRYYSVQLTDANTFNYGYMGSRTTGTGPGSYMIVGPDWKGETPPNIKQVFHSTTPFSVVISNPAFRSGGHAECGQDPGRLQGAATLGLFKATRSACGARNQLPQVQCRDCEVAVLRGP